MYGIRQTLLAQQRNDYSQHLSQGTFELDCSMGSNPYGVWPGLGCPETLFSHIELYPHSDEPVQRAICAYYDGVGLQPENVLLTCGSIGAMLTLNRMVLVPGKVILGLAPQFSAVVDDFVTYDADYRPVYLRAEDGYAFCLEDLLDAIKRNPCAYIYLDNPNNPTGQTISLSQTEQILTTAREMDSFVIMDEAYGDYMDRDQSAVHLISRFDNLAVVRTFSKGMGAAGVRLGYILGQKQVIEAAGKVNVPFSMNQIAEHVALSLLQSGWVDTCVARVRADKARLLAALHHLQAARTDPSVPITMLYTRDVEIDLCDLLERAGVRAITGVGYAGIGKNTVRLNLHADMDLLLRCLQRAETLLDQPV